MRPRFQADGAARSLPRLAETLTGALDLSGRVLCAFCLAVLFAALLANVLLRYVAGSGLGWAYEIHAIVLPWLVGGGIVVAAVQGRHIAITLLQDALGPVPARRLMLLIQLVVVVIAAGVFWSSLPILSAASHQRIPALGVTRFWGYLSLAYAFAGMGLVAALDALRLLSGEPIQKPDAADQSLS